MINFIPAPWLTHVPRAGTLNSVEKAASDRQVTLAAENAPVRFGYGRDRIGGQLVNVLAHGSYVVVQVLWGLALDAIESVTMGDDPLPAGTLATHYTGSQLTADAALVAAFAAQSPSITYSDTLAGLAYSVLRIPSAQMNALSFNAIVRWRKVYDPREAGQIASDPQTWAWSDNPSLALADFLGDATYGAGMAVDWDSVAAAADANDALLSGEKSRLIGWTCTGVSAISSIIETLRAYAGCFVVRRGNVMHLVPDAPAASSATYAHASGQIADHTAAEKRDIGNNPTRVEIVYTDTSKLPWRDRSAYSPPLAGETVRRLSTVRMPGVQRYSQAYREAVERLNKLNGNDLSIGVTVFDQGISHEIGDIVTVSLPFGGISAKPMRVTEVESGGPGLWKLTLTEYDPAVYSTEVHTEPTYDDTTLPSPLVPPIPSIETLSEEVYRLPSGLYSSRLRVTYSHAEYPWVQHYLIEAWESGVLVHSGVTTELTYVTPAVQDLRVYTVRVAIVSTVGARGDFASDTITASGKYLPPSDVMSISGFEAGGDVYLSWQAAYDLDIWRYELRYGPTTGTWETATLLDRVDALRYVSRGVFVAGVHRVYVKALDSVGNYSINAASVDITVSVDPDRLHTRWDQFSSPTVTDMVSYKLFGEDETWYVTEHGATVASIFTANPLGTTYPDVMASYQTNAANSYQTEEIDLGIDLQGDWTAELDATDISGASVLTLSLKPMGGSYTDYTSLPVKTAARYVRIKRSTTGEMRIRKGDEAVEVAAVTKKESGTGTSSGTGATTINLSGHYFAYRSVSITPITSSARIGVADNIVLHATSQNSFDAYVFDAAGSLAATQFSWAFEGV